MKVSSFALPLAAALVCQLAGNAASDSASPSKGKTNKQSTPTIEFLRPIKGEHFYDFPVYIQLGVDGFSLVPPDSQPVKSAPANTGHICYSLDDYPLYE